MGLKAAINVFGVAVPEAYVRMARLQGGKDDGIWLGEFEVYASEARAYPNGRTVDGQAVPATRDTVARMTVRVDYADADPRPLLYTAAQSALVAEYSATGVTNAGE